MFTSIWRCARTENFDIDYKWVQGQIFIANQNLILTRSTPLEWPLTAAIEAQLAEIEPGTGCEQEKISIFESEVELGGLAQNRLLPKKNLLHR